MLLYTSFHSKFLFSLFFHKDNNLVILPLYVLGNQRNFRFWRTRKNYSVSARWVINKLNCGFCEYLCMVKSIFVCINFSATFDFISTNSCDFQIGKRSWHFYHWDGKLVKVLFILRNYWRSNLELTCIRSPLTRTNQWYI